ncbi:S-layer homology domain-containing protein [Alkaliphilus crotonatoxidans]
MKKRTIILITLLLVLSCSFNSLALEIPGYEGGIQNEMIYQEVIFVTGEPILMTGSLNLKRSERNNRITETYNYRLENVEAQAKLTRSVKITIDSHTGSQQQQENYTIDSYSESIEVNGVRYATNKNNVQWSKSVLKQLKPGVTYFAGNWDGRKLYTINNNEGQVIVETRGDVVGYDQFWSSTETQTLNHYIDYQKTGNNPVSWQGTAKVEAVHNRTANYSYEPNSPSQISFRGGYLLTQQEENILKYSYDLPRLSRNGNVLSQRNTGTKSLSLDTNPLNQRLTIPEMRDILGHWAEDDILLLASLEAVYPSSSYYGPSLPMSRADFARAIAVVMDLVEEEAPTTSRRRSVQPTEEPGIFLDVSTKDPNEKYIKAVYNKGIMHGDGKGNFLPNQTVTKAEATTIIIRLLGFENLAPIQQYNTGFRDDAQIPIWAKDSVYIAKELSLISGNEENYFQPQKVMTKAEAATLMTNLIHYLQEDIRYDYRERILNF